MAKEINRRSAVGWILGLFSLRGHAAALVEDGAAHGSGAMAAAAGGIRDLADIPQTDGMVFNVRAYGAQGNALRDNRQHDTAAFQAAIDAAAARRTASPAEETASGGQGGVVFVPPGVYRVTRTLHLPQGVAIRGAGMHTSQVLFSLPAGQDGLVWSRPDDSDYGVGGFLEDIDIKAESYAAGRACRHLVVLSHWAHFAFHRVRILGASEYNLRIYNCVNISAFHLMSRSAARSNLWIGAPPITVTTTCRFVSCYFQRSLRGPAADVAGLGLAFDGCVFEDAGAETALPEAGEAYGIRVRGGTATLTAPYFEANRSWELIAGTDEMPANSPRGASVTVINAVVMPNHDRRGAPMKVPGTGGFRFERGSAFIQGGNLTQVQRPLVFSTRMDMVSATAFTFPNVPEVEGGTFAQLPGTVLYKDGATGQMVQAGNVVYGVNPLRAG